MQYENEKNRKIFLYILCGLAAVVLIIIAVIVSLGGEPDDDRADTNSIYVPENELLVSDIYEGDTLIPKFDLPLNKYDADKFKVSDGFLQYESSGATLGVDVSEYQGDIDWAQVKAAGIDFAILRLGYRGTTQGLLNIDSRFEQNLANAEAAGVSVGVYFFSQAISAEEAEAEAEFVIEALAGKKLSYPVVFDWEPPIPTEDLPAEQLRAYSMSGEAVTECAVAFCEKVKKAGYKPCVYTNKYMAYKFFDLEKCGDYDLWYAEYQQVPSLYYNFRMWQYTESGSVPGISGGVDMNICFKSY